jgi:lipopolysaccharide biosynthesis glycosyltransferase
MEMFDLYRSSVLYLEEGIFNMFFYDKWIKIPGIYNLYVTFLMYFHKIRYSKIHAIGLHFIRAFDYDKYRPWDIENPFYNEWINNLERAEFIDLSRIQRAKKWKLFRIIYYSVIYDFYLLYRFNFKFNFNKVNFNIVDLPDRMIGLVGIAIKRISPRLYYKIKGISKK